MAEEVEVVGGSAPVRRVVSGPLPGGLVAAAAAAWMVPRR